MRLIDADVAIEELTDRSHQAAKRVGTDSPFWEGLVIARRIVNNLPTIHSEPQWIPVSERMPESGTYCLFTVFEHDSELEATTIETVYGCFDDYGERRYWSWEDEFGNCCIMGEEQLDGDHDEIIEKVLAWMPLPEPYKPNNK